MKGWFDAFRDDGAPTLYSFSNRTPVTGDVSIVAVSVLFATLYIAFLVIFPGVRKQVRKERLGASRARSESDLIEIFPLRSPFIIITRQTNSPIRCFYVIFSVTKCAQSRPVKATESKSAAEDDDEIERRLLKTFPLLRAPRDENEFFAVFRLHKKSFE
jgi:Dual oxidase maturation factor